MVAGSAKAPQGLVVAAKNALAGPLPEVVQPDCTSKPLGPLDNEHPNAHDYAELGIICTHLDGTSTIAPTAVASAGAADRISGNAGIPRFRPREHASGQSFEVV